MYGTKGPYLFAEGSISSVSDKNNAPLLFFFRIQDFYCCIRIHPVSTIHVLGKSRYHSYSFSFETKIRTHDSVVVVCNLDGKINRTTAWENGTKNSGLLNFVPESRLPFVQISSI